MHWKEVIGLKKYKDELDRFALSEEAKQKLKLAVRQQEEPKRRRPYLRYASALVAAALVIVLVWPEKQANGIASILNGVMLDGTQYTKKYEPRPLSLAGMGGGFGKTGYAGSLYGGLTELTNLQEADANISSLPVYERYSYSDFTSRNAISIQEKEVLMDEFRRKLDAAAPIQIIEAVRGLDYYYDHQEYKQISILDDGTAYIYLNTSVIETQIKDADYVLSLAKQTANNLVKKLGYEKPVYRLRLTENMTYEVILTNSSAQLPLYQEAADAITIEFLDNYVEEHTWTPVIRVPNRTNITLIKDFSLMNKQEAEIILLHGGYYHLSQIKPFTKEDIIGCELIYKDDSAFAPYIIPCYRFYVMIDGDIRAMNVIAIQQDELRTLDKVTWYMDK